MFNLYENSTYKIRKIGSIDLTVWLINFVLYKKLLKITNIKA